PTTALERKRRDLDELERRRAFNEDRRWFDKHPHREFRCRRTWWFERYFFDLVDLAFVIRHRSDIIRGGFLYQFRAPMSFDPASVDDAWCRQAAQQIWAADHAPGGYRRLITVS